MAARDLSGPDRRRQFARRLAAGVFAYDSTREALARLSRVRGAALLQELEIGVAAVSTDLEQLQVA